VSWRVAPLTVTDHWVPVGRPVSVQSTGYVTAVNVTPTWTLPPDTFTLPLEGTTEYPPTGWTAYASVPFGTAKPTRLVAEETRSDPSSTDHAVPVGRPDSLNRTV
jgi:hypothetical protein